MDAQVAATSESAGPQEDASVATDLDTRERLVQAAVEVFLEKGYGGTRVQDIAKRAGFTSGALYVHFPSRTALLGEAILSEGRLIVYEMGSKLAAAADGEGSRSELFGKFITEPAGRIDILLVEAIAIASRSEDAQQVLLGALRELISIVDAQVDASFGTGQITHDLDRPAVGQLVLGMIFGGVVMRSLGLVTASPEALTEATLRMANGLRIGPIPDWSSTE